MIDQNLINQNILHAQRSMSHRRSTISPDLVFLDNVLDQQMLEKLQQYLKAVADHQWQSVAGQEKKPRQSISWDADTVIEELHEVFQSLTAQINDTFPGPYKNYWGVSVWKDRPGYHIDWHTDNPDIDVAMQIYVFGNPGLGTVFDVDGNHVLAPSQSNTGYMVCHSGSSKIPHRTENTTPSEVTRYSLYAVWSRIPKKAPDS